MGKGGLGLAIQRFMKRLGREGERLELAIQRCMKERRSVTSYDIITYLWQSHHAMLNDSLSKRLSGHLGWLVTPRSAEDMLDGQLHKHRVDIPAPARTTHGGHPLKGIYA